MQPHEQRVVDEKNDLDYKINKLDEFFDSELFEEISHREQKLMTMQSMAMEHYSAILGQRIKLFK